MATNSILLAPGAADFPDGSTGNAPPSIQTDKSSAAAPSPFRKRLGFNDSADQMCSWTFRMPPDYGSGPILKIQFKMFSDTNTAHFVRWEGRICAVTPGSADNANSRSFDTTNSVGTTIPDTVGKEVESSITLTNNDSLAAGDTVTVYLRRDADGTTGTDDATGDAQYVGGSLDYTTT